MTAGKLFKGKNIVFTLIFLLVYLVYSSLQSNDSTLSKLLTPQLTPTPVVVKETVEEDIIEEHEPEESAESGPEVTGVSSDNQIGQVIKVVDGDTIDVLIDGKKEKIRIIGLNTPETVDPRRPVECFGKEASNFAKQTLTGQSVILEPDPSQQERDRYGRLLRYVWMQNGTVDFGKLMIESGYGHEYTYEAPYKYQQAYKAAEQAARNAKKGLWSDVCAD